MKRLALLLAILLTFTLISGCSNTAKSDTDIQPEKNATENEPTKSQEEDKINDGTNKNTNDVSADYADYEGDWKIQVATNEELYLFTSLIEYFGTTGINIIAINDGLVTGSIYSVQGAPSYRQAEVAFEGKIEDGILQAFYEDEAWEYAGNIELTFDNDMILANITRDEAENSPMWGIPEGEFRFVRPIETEQVAMSDEEKESLEQFLFPTSRDRLQPFNEGGLTDEKTINFVATNLALGFIDTSEFGDRVEEGVEIVFDESVMDELAIKYFGDSIKEHQSFENTAYENGKYTVPALGGVSEYPRVQLLLEDTQTKGIYYAIADYMFEYPEDGEKLEYQHLIKLQKNDYYIIKAIQEIEYPIDFSL